KNVGCEACHGPAAAHSAGQGKVPITIPDEKVCLQCHTSEHDDHFVFSEKVKRLGCSVQPLTQKQETKQAKEEKKEESEGEKNTLKKQTEAPEQATASEPAETPTITPHGKKEKK
ncbi:MAG: hypothetical protein D3908_07875, partial [Candidatus Electrothrix sp. AUS4]|nr:hypothetical protein [Candidatus Electrothrix sp. AUS4]